MTRLLAFASFICFCVASLAAAAALTLEPLPGSTSQTTCAMCFFPNPIGVIVRDAAGVPMPNVPVTFSIPGLDEVMLVDIPSNEVKIMTGADGVAAPRFMGGGKDKATITATTPDAAPVTFNLKIKDKGPTRFEHVSGDGQIASLWTDFAQPWKIRALDRHGRPVPHAAVMFSVPDSSEIPGGLFGPLGFAVVAADESGIATSPTLTANAVQGPGAGGAFGFGLESPFLAFHFQNIGPPAPRNMSLVRAMWPTSEVGWSVLPYTVRVTDASSGAPAVSVPVVFSVDASCGYWGGGPTDLTVVTDSEGLATSTQFIGISATTACAISAKGEGAAPLRLPRHLFWPENVVISVDPASVEVAPSRRFDIAVTTTESGLPIDGRFLTVFVIRTGSATAEIGPQRYDDPEDPSTGIFTFFANPVPGSYTLVFMRDPVSISVPVTQRR